MASDPIKHVIVLMFENRSFDQMLACFQEVYPDLEGIPPGKPPRTNVANGTPYQQLPGAGFVAPNDPNHDFEHVLQQLANGNAGFVQDFANCYPQSTTADRGEIMKYHARGALTALHTLAENFTICDHWFSSLSGPTWPNRLFVHSGTSLGRVTMPEGVMNANVHWYNQTTVYDRLNEKKIPWKIYFGDIAQSWVLVDQWAPRNMINYYHMQRFYEDAAGPEDQFPRYVFIEPTYYPQGRTTTIHATTSWRVNGSSRRSTMRSARTTSCGSARSSSCSTMSTAVTTTTSLRQPRFRRTTTKRSSRLTDWVSAYRRFSFRRTRRRRS